jgi:large subunit ribosomal protein L31e
MGYIKNEGKSENQPKKEALDTNEDKSLEETKPPTEEEKPTQEEQKKEEITETKKDIEEATETVKEEGEVKGAEEEKEEVKEEAAEEVEEETPEEVAPAEAEEEEKVEEKKREAPEEEIVEERVYTIPLSRAWISPRKKRTPRAVRIVRSFVQKHMKIEAKAKTEEEEEETGRLVISDEVNKKLWSRGIEKPPRKIRVRAVKDKEGTVTLYLAEGD